MPILPPALIFNPMKDAAKVKVIDYTADFEIYLVSLLLTQNCTTQVKQKMIW